MKTIIINKWNNLSMSKKGVVVAMAAIILLAIIL